MPPRQTRTFRAMRMARGFFQAARHTATIRQAAPVKNDWPLATWNTSHRVSINVDSRDPSTQGAPAATLGYDVYPLRGKTPDAEGVPQHSPGSRSAPWVTGSARRESLGDVAWLF